MYYYNDDRMFDWSTGIFNEADELVGCNFPSSLLLHELNCQRLRANFEYIYIHIYIEGIWLTTNIHIKRTYFTRIYTSAHWSTDTYVYLSTHILYCRVRQNKWMRTMIAYQILVFSFFFKCINLIGNTFGKMSLRLIPKSVRREHLTWLLPKTNLLDSIRVVLSTMMKYTCFEGNRFIISISSSPSLLSSYGRI